MDEACKRQEGDLESGAVTRRGSRRNALTSGPRGHAAHRRIGTLDVHALVPVGVHDIGRPGPFGPKTRRSVVPGRRPSSGARGVIPRSGPPPLGGLRGKPCRATIVGVAVIERLGSSEARPYVVAWGTLTEEDEDRLRTRVAAPPDVSVTVDLCEVEEVTADGCDAIRKVAEEMGDSARRWWCCTCRIGRRRGPSSGPGSWTTARSSSSRPRRCVASISTLERSRRWVPDVRRVKRTVAVRRSLRTPSLSERGPRR